MNRLEAILIRLVFFVSIFGIADAIYYNMAWHGVFCIICFSLSSTFLLVRVLGGPWEPEVVNIKQKGSDDARRNITTTIRADQD